MSLVHRKLNAAKSKKLRPVRNLLALLAAALGVLALLYFAKPAPRSASSPKTAAENSEVSETLYFSPSGFLDLVEEGLEARLAVLGVPEEDFKNPAEYLTKDELFLFDTKVELASALDSSDVLATPEDLAKLKTVFDLDDDFLPEHLAPLETAPEEYLNLSDLLDTYFSTLNTVEDYDIIESV